jgi:hypothetical protein
LVLIVSASPLDIAKQEKEMTDTIETRREAMKKLHWIHSEDTDDGDWDVLNLIKGLSDDLRVVIFDHHVSFYDLPNPDIDLEYLVNYAIDHGALDHLAEQILTDYEFPKKDEAAA